MQTEDSQVRTGEGETALSLATHLRTPLAKSAAAVLISGCCLASPGFGATWEDVKPLCDRNAEACAMYVTGILDGLLLSNASDDPLEKYCPPPGGISNETGIKVFRKLLSDHPETATKQTAAMVHLALAQAFPCP
jgi:hypothetical protein